MKIKKAIMYAVAVLTLAVAVVLPLAVQSAPPSGAFYKQTMSAVNVWMRTTAGQARVYLGANTNSIFKIVGSGGTDDTDLYVDADGTYPVCYSSTDTKVGIDDDLEFVGAQAIRTSTSDLSLIPVGDLVITPTGGDVTITGAMSLSGAFSPNSVNVTGGVTCTALSVTGTSAMTGALNLDGDLTFTGAQQVTTSAGNLTVAAAGDVVITPAGGDITVTGALGLDGDLNFTGAQAITTTSGNLSLTPSGDITLAPTGNDVNVTGEFQSTQGATVPYLSVGGNASVAENGSASFAGGGFTVSSSGALGSTGTHTLNGDLAFTGAQAITTSADNLTLTPAGDLVANPTGGDFTFTGAMSLDGDLNFAGAQQITTTSGDLTLAPSGDVKLTPTGNDVNITGELDVNQGATVAYLSVGGNASVAENGSASFANGELTVASDGALALNTNTFTCSAAGAGVFASTLQANSFTSTLGATVGYLNVGGDAVFDGHVLGRNLLIPFWDCPASPSAQVIYGDGYAQVLGTQTASFYCPVVLKIGEEVTDYTVYGETGSNADTINATIYALDNSAGTADATGDASGAIEQITGATGDANSNPAAMTTFTIATNKAYMVKVTLVSDESSLGAKLFSINVAYNSKP